MTRLEDRMTRFEERVEERFARLEDKISGVEERLFWKFSAVDGRFLALISFNSSAREWKSNRVFNLSYESGGLTG